VNDDNSNNAVIKAHYVAKDEVEEIVVKDVNNSFIKTLIVYVSNGPVPSVDFIANKISGYIPLKVSFFDKSDSTAVSWEWDFGDGSTSKERNPIHTYKSRGKYSVTLKATNKYGTGEKIYSSIINAKDHTCPGIPVVKYKEKNYTTVQIGDQCWMKENLNYKTPGSWCYDNKSSNCDKYGRLYTWDAAMNGEKSSLTEPNKIQGICPPGWHIPSADEFTQLHNNVSSSLSNSIDYRIVRNKVVKTNLKSNTDWNGDTKSLFDALPAGRRDKNGDFESIGNETYFWTSTEYNVVNAINVRMIRLNSENSEFSSLIGSKSIGRSVRCIKD
jgi:uncharacterized protein (TIGR02145 family)